MHHERRARFSFGIPLALAACFASPGLVAAQGGDGFLFREPSVSIKFETGYAVQFTNSEIFDLSRDELTVSRRDFDAPYVGGEIAARIGQRFDLALGFGFSKSSHLSEYRDYYEPVGNSDLPIEQTTTLRLVPVTLSAKYYLTDRGRTVGRFAWVPNTLAPYLGVGLGAMSYAFEQSGDFIDLGSPDLDIFFDTYRSDGTTALFRALVGTSVSLGSQFELTGEARYQYARAEMGRDFDGFDPLDLSGVQGVVGIAIRF